MDEIRTRDVPEQVVVTEQRTVDHAELPAWLPGAMARVVKAAEEFGGVVGSSALPHLRRADHPDQPVIIVVYDGNPHEGPAPVEVCAPIDAGRIDTGREAPAHIPTRRLPAHREAYLRVTKEVVESGQVGGVFAAVEQWADTHGLRIADAPRETYWTDFGAAGPTDEVFDVSFPVEDVA